MYFVINKMSVDVPNAAEFRPRNKVVRHIYTRAVHGAKILVL